MAAPRWTPGPLGYLWLVAASANGGGHCYIIDKDDRKIAACWGYVEEKAANAQLWSTAPELYEALKALAAEHSHDLTTTLARAKVALAKARGEVP